MKTFNKTLIAATTIATFGLAAAPSALAVDASASIATTYLFRGAEMNSGSAAVSVDVSSSTGALTYGVWVSSGDGLNEYDLYADYSGSMGALGYSVGFIDYNYSQPTANRDIFDIALANIDVDVDEVAIDDIGDLSGDFEEAYIGLSYGPASVTYYDAQDSDADYTVFGLDAGAMSFAYGESDDGAGETSTHFDVSFAVNDSLSLTVSKPEDVDAIVVASYAVSF